jgi:hypothetical protein
MSDAFANATNNAAKTPSDKREPSPEPVALHLCYGEIGISAVAAAVRYQGSAKNQAYAPVPIKFDDRAALA